MQIVDASILKQYIFQKGFITEASKARRELEAQKSTLQVPQPSTPAADSGTACSSACVRGDVSVTSFLGGIDQVVGRACVLSWEPRR